MNISPAEILQRFCLSWQRTSNGRKPSVSVSPITVVPGTARRRLNNLLIPLSRDWTDFTAKAHEFIVEGNRVVALGTYSGTCKATGKSTTAEFANIWTVRANKLQSFHMHTDTAKVLEAMTK